MASSYQQYMPSQSSQIPSDTNSLNQTLLPNAHQQIPVQGVAIQFSQPNGPMNNGLLNTNYDQIVTLRATSTWAYCSNCKCIVQTQLRSSCAFVATFICIFMSTPLLAALISMFAPEYAPVVMPVTFTMIFIILLYVIITQSRAKHYCPQCKQVIGRAGQTVRIPAQANRS